MKARTKTGALPNSAGYPGSNMVRDSFSTPDLSLLNEKFKGSVLEHFPQFWDEHQYKGKK